ncbi:MAG TPA: hypothetical protein VMT24_09110 [Aggregatilineaceae bacterium]|nr:hypothetical protein [Aggregatilineaceae bacterium]
MVKLTWSPAPTATGYFIYRDGNQVPLNPKPIPQSAYDDIGLTNGRTYSYVVAAVDEAGKIIQRSEAVPIIPKAG